MSKRNPVKKGRGGLDAASIEAQLVALFDTELHSSTPGPLSCFAAADVARLEAQVEGLQAALWAQAAENVQLKAQLHTALTHGHFDHHYDDEGRWGGADDHVDDEGIIDHIAATFVPQHEIEQRVQSNAHRKRTSHVVIDLHALPGTDSVRRVSSRLDGEVSDAGDFAAEAPPLLSLSKFGFPCLDLSHEATFGAVIVMFEEGLGLLSHFQIPTKWLANYCMYLTGELTTGDADGRDAVLPYRGIPYHNWYHGFSVCQGVFSILASNTSLQDTVPKSFQLAIMLAALAHDAGHDGRNNVFHIVSHTDLSATYNDQSPLENMHTHNCFAAMRQVVADGKPCSNVLANVPVQEQASMAKGHGANGHEQHLDMEDVEDRNLLLTLLLHASDVSNPGFPWEEASRWATMACKEFRMQAVKERVDGIAVSTFMDIRDAEMLSGNQAGFCKFVLPFVRNLAVQVPQLQAVADGIRTNLVKWDETTSRGVAALPAAPKALFGEIMLLGRQWSELAEAVLTDDAGGSFELGKLQNAVVFVADNADDDNGKFERREAHWFADKFDDFAQYECSVVGVYRSGDLSRFRETAGVKECNDCACPTSPCTCLPKGFVLLSDPDATVAAAIGALDVNDQVRAGHTVLADGKVLDVRTLKEPGSNREQASLEYAIYGSATPFVGNTGGSFLVDSHKI